MKTIFKINNTKYTLNTIGKIVKPIDKVILKNEINLISKTNWHEKGFKNLYLINSNIQRKLQNKIKLYLKKKISKIFSNIPFEKIKLEKYHLILSNSQHYKFLKHLENGINFKEINFNKEILEKAVSRELKINVSTMNRDSKKINPKSFAIRIVRPGKNDFNPPHKDIYLKRLKNGVNIYMPIIGSNLNSSLPLMPRSHNLNEKDIIRTINGVKVNNIKFRVPCIVGTKRGLYLKRPNPNMKQIMIFSPYLIHGGGLNENKNTTRFSLELRFWKTSPK